MQAQMKSPALIPPEAQGTFLPPVEKPRGLRMKLVYVMTRRQFGKVLTPLKVFCARLPVAFGQFYGKISAFGQETSLAATRHTCSRRASNSSRACRTTAS